MLLVRRLEVQALLKLDRDRLARTLCHRSPLYWPLSCSVQPTVYGAALIVVSFLLFLLLRELNGLLALFFLIGALAFVPALAIQRREAAYGPELGPGAESQAHGGLRLAQDIGIDLTGVSLGLLVVILG